ncbi:hypothetical protein ANRL1_01103 [Anaerolineae bacterium]|nr:hypothetical protein ANRL1_01103 [Anaerolineae bacterium]
MDSPEKSMPVTISSTEVQRQFGQVIRRTYLGREHFIVQKDGLPVAAIISMKEYQDFIREREARESRLQEFRQATREMGDEAEQLSLTEDEVEAKVEAVRQRLYEERHGNRSTK